MGIVTRNRAFLLTALLILVVGAVIFGAVMGARVLAASGVPTTVPPNSLDAYNGVSSYGITGYPALTVVPTAETPTFIKQRLAEKRAIVLLVYVDGAADDMSMLQSFDAVKAQYAAESSFMDFEARKVTELGDTLQLLHVYDPPILAVIQGDGKVYQLYTGWIGRAVMEQVVADAVRGI